MSEVVSDGGDTSVEAAIDAEAVPHLTEPVWPSEPPSLGELRKVRTIGVQVSLQATINAHEPVEALTADQQSVLRVARVDQPAIDHWDVDIPLVLSVHDYEPYGFVG